MSKLSRYFNLMVVLVLVVTLFAAHQPAKAQSGGTGNRTKSGNSTAPFVPGEVVVGFGSGKQLPAYTAQATALANGMGAAVERVSADGAALLQVAPDADVQALASQLSGQAGVKFAEPNYIFSLPPLEKSPAVNQDFVLQRVAKEDVALSKGKTLRAVRVSDMGGHPNNSDNSSSTPKVTSTFPNDPYLWENNGWSWIGADIVWPNKTASAGICEVDTGVDYNHPDLAKRIIKGYDYVNDDADPMDDNGHGTAVAGILAANQNNKIGMAGVSTGNVVAVKVMNAQGSGTSFNIAQGIDYCANRKDIKVINMSLGGPADSDYVYWAVYYAVNNMNKLIVTAAGNTGDDSYQYPAAYSDPVNFSEFQDEVLSVAAAGQVVDVTDTDGNTLAYVDNNCMAPWSTYGAWVSVAAPGMDIYTTMPWDKPFYLNYYYGVATRYDYFSGTSAASPFVAATAARRWGFQPNEPNYQIGWDISDFASSSSGYGVDTNDSTCDPLVTDWPSEMSGKAYANVAAALQRFGLIAGAYDAATGLPLVGAQIQAYQGSTLRGTGTVIPSTSKNASDPDPARVYTDYTAYTEILNLPAGGGYQAKISKSGYTAGAQAAYQHYPFDSNLILNGYYGYAGVAAVPPASSKFELALGWLNWYRQDLATKSIYGSGNLDLDVWIPNAPNGLDPYPPNTGQLAPFIAGVEGTDYGIFDGDSTGETGVFPHAMLQREGGFIDPLTVETIVIDSRKAHGPLATNAALPYYPGTYAAVVTDTVPNQNLDGFLNQTIDDNNDGCGNDYYDNIDQIWITDAEPDTCSSGGSAGIPLLGTYLTPYVYFWKDGAVKLFSDMKAYNGGNPYNPGDPCNADEWGAVDIFTNAVKGPLYYGVPYYVGGAFGQLCGSYVGPYVKLPGVDSRANMKNWLNMK